MNHPTVLAAVVLVFLAGCASTKPPACDGLARHPINAAVQPVTAVANP